MKVGLDLGAFKEQHRELGLENWKVASEFNKCKDPLKNLVKEKMLAESTGLKSPRRWNGNAQFRRL